MGELIHETAGRVKRRRLLLLLLLFKATRRNWIASKTIVEDIGFRWKLIAGLQETFMANAICRLLLLFLVGKWKICWIGKFCIENAIRVLMELFRCIHVVVRSTDAVGAVVVIVVAHVTRTLELVQIHQLSH